MAEGYHEESASQFKSEEGSPVIPPGEAAIVQEGIDFYQFVTSYEDLQRADEREQGDFDQVDMWTTDARTARSEHDDSDGNKIPAKPTLSANLNEPNIQLIVNEARQARLALTVKPKAGIANTKITGYVKGLLRSIQVTSGSLSIRLWALERAARLGRGAYRIDADYANDGDFDLDLMLKRVLDQSTVYFDPYSQEADYKDGERCLITDMMSVKRRKEKWPHKPLVAPDGAFTDENGI